VQNSSLHFDAAPAMAVEYRLYGTIPFILLRLRIRRQEGKIMRLQEGSYAAPTLFPWAICIVQLKKVPV
jgi:hypothetical protein